jgi:hypothetical protein
MSSLGEDADGNLLDNIGERIDPLDILFEGDDEEEEEEDDDDRFKSGFNSKFGGDKYSNDRLEDFERRLDDLDVRKKLGLLTPEVYICIYICIYIYIYIYVHVCKICR